MSKPLFILVSNGGDGSYSPTFTLDSQLIADLEVAHNKGLLDCEYDAGVDGDGFHYTTINVPDDATCESLGILYPLERSDYKCFN